MTALYPGSFDPITRGHLSVIRRALVFCPKLVIAIGSNGTKQYVFNAQERIALIKDALQESLSPEEITRIEVTEFSGAVIHYAEKIGANLIIKGLRNSQDYADEERMVMVNRHLSEKIDTIFLMTENDLRDVSSSVVREMARIGIPAGKMDHYLTPSVRDKLLNRVKSL
jgi:pantetheine-phosphate adenylyltransferase